MSGGLSISWRTDLATTPRRRRGRRRAAARLASRPLVEVLERRVVPTNSATFIMSDTATQGDWSGTYGVQGYDIEGSPASLPAYASVGFTGASTTTWAASTTDARALQTPGGSSRAATAWSSASSFTIDLNLTDGLVHDVALYALDWDRQSRQEQAQIINAGTGQVLDTESLANFGGGEYLQWAVRGHVRIVVTNQGPVNAVVSGLFLDPAATAAFVGQDSTTQGTWIGAYGAQGYDIEGSPASLPSYAALGLAGTSTTTWAASTTDSRALQTPGGSSAPPPPGPAPAASPST